jgi:hypothetical protein
MMNRDINRVGPRRRASRAGNRGVAVAAVSG